MSKEYEKLEKVDSETAPIFVLWLQGGIDAMPEPVQLCYKSLQKNCRNHPINLITAKNLSEYIQLPDYIIQKHDTGLISHAFFSDILRAALLDKFGGMWIDATVFLSKTLPLDYFSKDFFSPCGFYGIKKRDWKYLFDDCNGWSIWCMATGYIHYPLFSFLVSFYYDYLQKQDTFIDYFQTDFSIALFYKNNEHFKTYMDSQPANNQNAYYLADLMNNIVTKKKLKKLDFLDYNIINKLTYKRNWKKSRYGRKTVYSSFMD